MPARSAPCPHGNGRNRTDGPIAYTVEWRHRGTRTGRTASESNEPTPPNAMSPQEVGTILATAALRQSVLPKLTWDGHAYW
ncbi:MAG: hypothetical protein QOE76_2651 [Frankiales bacterium]|nr:hypothetical protein [Frankiales bacterium]